LTIKGGKMMKARSMMIFAMVLGLFFVFSDISQVTAQESKADEFTLEEITVTAQKRVENQQKVPITMETVSGDELALKGKTNVDDILSNLSNVSINTMSDGMRISIRGLTDDTSISDSNFKVSGSMVGVNIDGAQNSMSSAGQNLFDVERVEVLYGPQSTLYGSNSPGGIVNVVTAAPKTDKYSASFGINYGSYHLLNMQTALNAPVIQDKLALRLAVSKSRQNSYVTDTAGSNDTAVRLKALWQASDNLTITLTPSWSKSGNGGMMGGAVKVFDKQNGYWYTFDSDTSTWTKNGKVTNPWTKSSDTSMGGGSSDSSDQTTKGLSGNIDWKTAIGTVSMVPSYSKSSSDSTQTDFADSSIVYDVTQSSIQKGAEVRVTNPESFTLFQWIVGATYNQWNQDQTYVTISGSAANEDYYANQKKKALYTNVTYPLWFYNKFSLNAGYRLSKDENISRSRGIGGSGTPNTQSGTYKKPDVKFGFNWDAADEMMVYGSYADSYRSIDAHAAAGSKPEQLLAYTLGGKSRLFDKKLQLNGSVYYYHYKNKGEQTEERYKYVNEDPEHDYSGDGDYTDTNVKVTDRGAQLYGTFKSLGEDISATWIMTSEDRLSMAVSHLDAKWSNLVQPASTDYPEIWPDAISYKNNINANSPKWSMTASYEHNFVLGELGMLTPSIDAQYKSAYDLKFDPSSEDNTGLSYQEAYTLWNASVSFNDASNKWSLNASVKNIFNYAVKRSYIAHQSNVTLMLGDPRVYEVGFSIKF
jgi:iron complex outermembrane recepter protein